MYIKAEDFAYNNLKMPEPSIFNSPNINISAIPVSADKNRPAVDLVLPVIDKEETYIKKMKKRTTSFFYLDN